MTVRQLQLLLSYLDYSPGEIDGVAGEKTKSAVEAFQRAEGLAADGEAGVKTQEKLKEAVFQGRFRKQEAERFWKDIRYFSRNEPYIACPCGKCGGFPTEPVEKLMRLADRVRAAAGVGPQQHCAVQSSQCSRRRRGQFQAPDGLCHGLLPSGLERRENADTGAAAEGGPLCLCH